MAITKAEFAEHLVNELGFNKREAKQLVELFFEDLKEALEQGEPIKISGFGTFGLRDKSSRPGRNPKTGEAVPVTARRIVAFKAGKKLKAQVGRSMGYREQA